MLVPMRMLRTCWTMRTWYQPWNPCRMFSDKKPPSSGSDETSLHFKEQELEEQFIRGWGPGGQKINKTSNCVMLKHLPSGIIIKCQDSRSQSENRRLARVRLQNRLDVLLLGSESRILQQEREGRAKAAQKHLRAKRRLELKRAFKEREGLTDKTVDDNSDNE